LAEVAPDRLAAEDALARLRVLILRKSRHGKLPFETSLECRELRVKASSSEGKQACTTPGDQGAALRIAIFLSGKTGRIRRHSKAMEFA
jgi:hypothetical protein